ncbi:MAG: (2Fe-2S)-binding protein [Aquirufa sp.]|jgi:aerobic-type carbon monoxide dehydrogenase small subunit (CoxS/CutS family)
MIKKYSVRINKKVHQVEADENMPLLWVLRDILGMEGTKYGCGVGSCGACTVHLNGSAVRSCQLPISALAGQDITTIEGLSAKGDHPVQKAWLDVDVAQCGYCQSGQIMSAAALLKSTPNPTEEDIENFMTGNICRCGTYTRIKKAIQQAAAKS